MTAAQAAAVLGEIAALLEITGGDAFRARAFQAAARSLETSGADLPDLARRDALTSIPGVGAGIAGVLRDLVETGESPLHARLVADTPPGLFDLMRIPGLGAKRIRAVHAGLGVDSLDALEAAAADGRLATLPGFGAKTAARIAQGVAFARAASGRRRLPAADQAARALVDWLRARPDVRRAEPAGEVRRRLEVVERVAVCAVSDDPAALAAAVAAAHGGVVHGETVDFRLSDGVAARVAVCAAAGFGRAWIEATGSAAHLADLAARAAEQGWGSLPDAPEEEAVYAALGLAWVPPELREGWGEVAAAATGALPRLVTTADLRGTFHCHTTWSDGKATVAEMAEGARARGWAYLGIADHSQAAAYAGGLRPDAVRRQHAEIDAWNAAHGGGGRHRFRLFKGVEADILADGRLDYDDDVLASFDYVVGSVHSAFGLGERAMTDRLVRAVSHPRITMLGHATGRLLLRRDAYAVDVRAVIDAAAAHGVAVEINADPARLDVDWRHARYAAERGVLVPVNPDAHSVGGMDNVAWGVDVARKAWLTARQVPNTWELDELETHLAERKQARAP